MADYSLASAPLTPAEAIHIHLKSFVQASKNLHKHLKEQEVTSVERAVVKIHQHPQVSKISVPLTPEEAEQVREAVHEYAESLRGTRMEEAVKIPGYITVHMINTGNEVLIKADAILALETLERQPSDNASYLTVAGRVIYVKETPAQIAALIEEAQQPQEVTVNNTINKQTSDAEQKLNDLLPDIIRALNAYENMLNTVGLTPDWLENLCNNLESLES